MRSAFFFLGVLLALPQDSLETLSNAQHYVGAVVNYVPEWAPHLSAEENVMKNAAAYSQFIRHAALQMADIIVFPEMGLRGHQTPYPFLIPSPSAKVQPCQHPLDWAPVLSFLSCSVQDWGIYTVINVDELVPNNVTGAGKLVHSHVVFDRNGAIIARYRQGSNEVPHFDTDFGVRFGLLSDQDLLVGHNTLTQISKANITHLAMPSSVTNRLPFLTGLQLQWSWSWSHNLGLLASGLTTIRGDQSGSGLYCGKKGAIAYTTAEHAGSRLVLQAVPKNSTVTAPHVVPMWDMPLTQAGEMVRLTRSPRSSTRETFRGYKTELMMPQGPAIEQSQKVFTRVLSLNKTICQNSLCCSFNITTRSRYTPKENYSLLDRPRKDDMSRGLYRLVVFSGVQQVTKAMRMKVQRCGVVSCLDSTLKSCGARPDEWFGKPEVFQDFKLGEIILTGTEFTKLVIRSNSPTRPNILLTGTSDNFGAPPKSSQFEFDDKKFVLSFNKSVSNLISASLEATEATNERAQFSLSQTWTTRV